VLDEGHCFPNASGRLWLIARQLDQPELEESATAYAVSLRNALHVAVKRNQDRVIDIGNRANEVVR
jgi:hypothetical protein